MKIGNHILNKLKKLLEYAKYYTTRVIFVYIVLVPVLFILQTYIMLKEGIIDIYYDTSKDIQDCQEVNSKIKQALDNKWK